MRSYGSSANELSCPSGSALFRRSLLDASERLVSFSRFRQHEFDPPRRSRFKIRLDMRPRLSRIGTLAVSPCGEIKGSRA
jgi:hypothetical protein